MDIPRIMRAIKIIQRNRFMKKLIMDPDREENNYSDENKMDFVMLLGIMMKIFKLILIIANLSYFIGMSWLIMCRLEYHWFYDELHMMGESNLFFSYFNLDERNDMYQLLASMYFAFTSFSTVGLGDYYPRSSLERVFGTVILCLGVMIFSSLAG